MHQSIHGSNNSPARTPVLLNKDIPSMVDVLHIKGTIKEISENKSPLSNSKRMSPELSFVNQEHKGSCTTLMKK
jgi:hypothetical protein